MTLSGLACFTSSASRLVGRHSDQSRSIILNLCTEFVELFQKTLSSSKSDISRYHVLQRSPQCCNQRCPSCRAIRIALLRSYTHEPAILCIMVLCVSLYCFMFISLASFLKRKFRLVKYYYIHVHLVSLRQLTGIAMDLLQIGVLFKFANYCYDITMIRSVQDETFMLQGPACGCYVFLSSTGEWNRA